MNTLNHNTQMGLRTLISAIVIFTLAACGEKKKEVIQSPVLRIEERTTERETDCLILAIQPDGRLEIGRRRPGLVFFPGHPNLPFWLEGRGQVGDRVKLIYHSEVQFLENGAVKTVIKKIGAKSLRNKELEDLFQRAPKAGGDAKDGYQSSQQRQDCP